MTPPSDGKRRRRADFASRMEQHLEVPQELAAALVAHGEALAAELQLLDDMPQVMLSKASVFDRADPPGSVAQKRGVICRLRCCGKPIDQKCNDLMGDAACPTQVEAARLLRARRVRAATLLPPRPARCAAHLCAMRCARRVAGGAG